MKIHIPTPLRSYTGGLETVSISGATVEGVFEQLTAAYPDLKPHLFTPEGKQDTAVKDTDELTIIPSIAGGANS